MNVLFYLLVVVVALALVGVAFRYHKRYHVLPYLFFVRFPVAMGIGMVAFPIVAQWFAPTMLRNAFEVGRFGAHVIGFIGTYSMLSVLYNILLIWKVTPLRCGLIYNRKQHWDVRKRKQRDRVPQVPDRLLSGWADLACCVLIAPIWLVVSLNCEAGRMAGFFWFLVGSLLAYGMRYLLAASVTLLNRHRSSIGIDQGIRRFLSQPTPSGLLGFVLSPLNGYRLKELHFVEFEDAESGATIDALNWIAYLRLHLRSLVFFSSWLLVYLIGFFFLRPTQVWVSDYIPALSYVMVLMTALTWLSSFFSFLFDSSRLPIFTVGLAILVLFNWVAENDHTYRMVEEGEMRESLVSVEDALDAFSAALPEGEASPVVVVAASGGGITASLWTTTVLDGLARASGEAFDFHRHVAAVSSVSGGSVGNIHYLNAFGENGESPEELDTVVEASAYSSLSAATWGMAYVDFFRLFTGPLQGTWDRAQVQEQVWDRLLNEQRAGTDEDLLVGDWAGRVARGAMPIPLLNATFEETGQRLVVAPVTLSGGWERGRENLLEFLPAHDVRASTAARLSATFPYVTPQARPHVAGASGVRAYHAADGGFYDNSGIVTLLDVLDIWLKAQERNAGPKRRIVLIEIRAGTTPPEAEEEIGEKRKRRRFYEAVTGPLATMFSVRSSSQLARNQFEIELFREAWKDEATFEHFSFELGGDTPLSWHLSKKDKERIRSYWPELAEERGEGWTGEKVRVVRHNAEQLVAFLESVRAE